MTFNFPDNKTIYRDIIQNFEDRKGRVHFSNIDILNPADNLIEIDGVDYCFTYLNGATPGNKGGNSILLKLYNSQEIDSTNIEYDEPDLILKISKFKKSANPRWATKAEQRFVQEIEALERCQQKSFQNVVRIFHSGICKIRNQFGHLDEHLFYTMEYAEFDLKTFVEQNHREMDVEEKLALCISLCEGIKELYSLGYYHRDIKPDNIFIIDNVWKVGDLGLVDDRTKPNLIDKAAEFIGPRGWISPESMNKYLCEGKNFCYKHNCVIDHQSDIFQLGKVFWYIFQCNAPIGSVKEKDFLIKNSRIYAVLKTMLSHSKQRRYKNVDEIIKLLKLAEKSLLKKMAA